MEFWSAFQAFVLGVVEGLTEFLPVSSTGHQIIVADLLGFVGERAQAFNIIIQLAAILAVVWEFRGKILEVICGLPSQPRAQRFTVNLLVAFFPAVVLGVAFADLIHHYLFNPITVAAALVVGGVVMLWAEKREHRIRAESVDDMTWKDALKVGCAQCLALGILQFSGDVGKHRIVGRKDDLLCLHALYGAVLHVADICPPTRQIGERHDG